ncbi:MAG: hypothetical protein PHH84_04970 [Oscillospiraceae bacterium]|nr:hypothetical protein [Oscillospiraceae bacterium]
MKQYPRYVVISAICCHISDMLSCQTIFTQSLLLNGRIWNPTKTGGMESDENGRIWNPPLLVFEADLCVSPKIMYL